MLFKIALSFFSTQSEIVSCPNYVFTEESEALGFAILIPEAFLVGKIYIKNMFKICQKFAQNLSRKLCKIRHHIFVTYHISANSLHQRFTTKGWTETAIMLCKLNKSL